MSAVPARGVPADALTILREAATAAAGTPGHDAIEKAAALGEIARAQAGHDREGARATVDLALRTLAQMTRTETYTSHAVVKLAVDGAAGEGAEIQRTIDRAAAMSPALALAPRHGYAQIALVDALARAGEYTAALERARRIADVNDRLTALTAVAESHARAADRGGIERAAAAAKGRAERAAMLARSAAAWPDGRRAADAAWVLAESLRAADAIARKNLRHAVLVDVARLQIASRDLEGAARIAERLDRAQDRWHFVEVVAVLAPASMRGARSADTRGWLTRGHAAALRLPVSAGFKGGSPRASALARMAQAFADSRDAAGATALAASISQEAPGFEALAAETFFALAKTAATAGNTEAARVACASARALARSPEEAVRYRWSCGDRDGARRALADRATAAAAAASLSQAEAAADDLTAALEAARAIPDARSRTLALAELVPRFAAQGDVAGAAQLAHAVDDASRRTYALQAVAWARVRTGDAAGALAEARAEPAPLGRARMLLASPRRAWGADERFFPRRDHRDAVAVAAVRRPLGAQCTRRVHQPTLDRFMLHVAHSSHENRRRP